MRRTSIGTIAVLGLDSSTISGLISLGYSCSSYHSLMENRSEAAVICTSEIVGIHELERLKESFPSSRIFYINTLARISNFRSTEIICSQYGIKALPPGQTAKSIAKELDQVFGVKEDVKDLVGFFGTGAGVGVTSVAGEFCKALASKGLKVALLGLNLYDPGYNVGPKVSLDQWKSRLTAKVLTESDFDQLVKVDGYSYLPGNYDYIGVKDYSEEEIELLVELAQSVFDVVVGDFGSHPDSAAWSVGMQYSTVKYLVSTPNHNDRAKRILQVAKYFDAEPSDFALVVNKSDAYSDSGLTPKLLSNELKVPLVLEVPFISNPMKQLSLALDKSESKKLDEIVSNFVKVVKG